MLLVAVETARQTMTPNTPPFGAMLLQLDPRLINAMLYDCQVADDDVDAFLEAMAEYHLITFLEQMDLWLPTPGVRDVKAYLDQAGSFAVTHVALDTVYGWWATIASDIAPFLGPVISQYRSAECDVVELRPVFTVMGHFFGYNIVPATWEYLGYVQVDSLQTHPPLEF